MRRGVWVEGGEVEEVMTDGFEEGGRCGGDYLGGRGF